MNSSRILMGTLSCFAPSTMHPQKNLTKHEVSIKSKFIALRGITKLFCARLAKNVQLAVFKVSLDLLNGT